MDKTCKKCGNNLYGNKLRCPFCGEPISKSSAFSSAAKNQNNNRQYQSNQFTYAKRPTTSSNRPRQGMNLGFFEALILLLIAFFVPPFGLVFFFGFNKDHPNFSYLALTVGIFGFLRYVT